MRRLTCPLTLSLMLTAASAPAFAEWNPTPIAVPLLNAETAVSSPGAPYPSTITVAPPGGANHVAFLSVTLHAVTHPCPDDLAVLLVRGTEKYLLMSNAGGCRPLQGTDIKITSFSAGALLDHDAGPPYDALLEIAPSNYAPAPVFPAPAPAGPYTPGLPPDVPIQGTWSLYVMDLHAASRGVIAGGWSITYNTSFFTRTMDAPALIPLSGPASPYPITFDLSRIDASTRAGFVTLEVQLQHGWSDDIRMVLESPNGTAVILMANAGGNSPLESTTTIRFGDLAPTHMPDGGPLGAGPYLNYKPGSIYELPIAPLPSPAPPGPYDTAFSVFQDELARGIWKLWVYDDFDVDAGQFVNGWLTITPPDGAPGLSIYRPSDPMSTANQPFARIEGGVNNAYRPFAAIWRNVVDGVFYDAGPLNATPFPALSWALDGTIPFKKGTNVVTVTVLSNFGGRYSWTSTITVNGFAYSLSEGATGAFFDEDVTIANPTGAAAPITVDFLQEGAPPITHASSVAADAPLQLHVDGLVPPGAVSTVVHSPNGVPLAVERTMSWDAAGYGGHGGTALVPDTQWLFAEGSQGFFDTYVLIANDNAAPVDATVRFFLEGGGVVNRPLTLEPKSRVTIYAGDLPALVNMSFGIEVLSSGRPITAERAMYFPHTGARLFEGGHEAAGANRVSKRWFLAEGATGPFFECFVLLSNPGGTVAHTTLTYLLPSGETVTQTIDVPATGRTTINVETVDARLVNTPVSTIITADQGIVVERSMYWPDISLGWREAHNSIGTVDPALRWGVSDIRVGGARGAQTYVLLANPNPAPAEVRVRLLRSGAAPIVQSYTLQPTSRTNIFAADLAGADGIYSMDVQVLNYQPIVVEKALYWNAGSEVWAAGTGVVATPLPPQ